MLGLVLPPAGLGFEELEVLPVDLRAAVAADIEYAFFHFRVRLVG
jgi:hypothetical protein